MTNSTVYEDRNIDQARIVTDVELPSEYFCPICQSLLWKPISCSACQNVFCQHCIHLWSQNTDGVRKCPFRCQSFIERPCPPYFQSLLSRLHIRCRNQSFGCTEILSYDALEQHENVHCHFLTRACAECQRLVLVDKWSEHESRPGECVPLPVKCVICEEDVPKQCFREHFQRCYHQRVNDVWTRGRLRQNLQQFTPGVVNVPNEIQLFLETNVAATQLIEQQRNFSRLPSKLKGLDEVRESRQEQYGYFYRVYTMIKFILMNWSKAPFLLSCVAKAGFVRCTILLAFAFFFLLGGLFTCFGPKLLIIFCFIGLIHFAASSCLQWFSDYSMMLVLIIFFSIDGCSMPLVFEQLEMDPAFDKPFFSIFGWMINVLLIKLGFLILRLYFWCISTYVAIGFCILLAIYIHYKHGKTSRPLLQTAPSAGLNFPL